MENAQPMETFGRLRCEHRGAIVREQCTRESSFLECLRKAMNQRLGGFVEVPLEVATESRPVVEDAEQLRLLPFAGWRKDGARALVEVEMPEPVHAPAACAPKCTRAWAGCAATAR